MIVLNKLDEDGMPITENITATEEEFEIVKDGKTFLGRFIKFSKLSKDFYGRIITRISKHLYGIYRIDHMI